MQRIATLNKAVDLFGAGKHGFKNGNLAGGIAATEFEAAWFNGVQEELLAVIEAAGLVPSGATLNQLLLALRAAGVFTTPAQFDNTTKPATTAFVRNELLGLGNAAYAAMFGASLGANGWLKHPSGLILQWGAGTSSGTAASNGSVTFPLNFPNAARQVYGAVGGSSPGDYTIQTTTSNTAGATFTVQRDAGGASGVGFSYFAIGN
jgi:hypothetical protein